MRHLVPPTRLPSPFPHQNTLLHGGDYNPDQWLPSTPDILEQDARLMRLAGINSASVGIFSWTALEPSEGNFSFDFLDRTFDAQHAIGNRVVLATPSGAMPAWLAEKYPEARRVDKKGLRAHWGDRHNHCWSSPAFHDRVAAINTRLAERYENHPALALWHISNELSGQCYCNLCRARWACWLEEKYGSLQKMNDAHWAGFWSHTATAWHHVEPTETVLEGRVLDWYRFANDQLIAWYQFEESTLRPHTGDRIPITTNFMGFAYGLDYQRIARVVDVVCDDQYPTLHPDGQKNDLQPAFHFQGAKHAFRNDLYRNFTTKDGSKRPFFLMESCPGAVQWNTPQKLKRPGIHRLEMLTALAAGADGTSYFQFRACRGSMEKLHGSVVMHAGTDKAPQTRMFQEVQALSQTYSKLNDLLGTGVNAEVALVYDWESKWAQRTTNGTDVSEWRYDDIAVEQYLPFWNAGIPVDPLSPDRDFSRYKLLILPQLWIITEELAARLRAFVQNGGTLVATFDTGMTDEFNRMHQNGYPGLLTDVFGLWVDETDRLAPGTPRKLRLAKRTGTLLKGPLGGTEVAALPHNQGAAGIAEYDEDFYAGKDAISKNPFGKGVAYYVGTRLDEASNRAFYNMIQENLSLQKVIDADLPVGVTAQLRGAGAEAFVFLLNYTTTGQTVPLGTRTLTHAESGDIHTGTVALPALAAEVYRLKL